MVAITGSLFFGGRSTHTHYITGRMNLLLTYPAEIDMRRKLIEASKFCKEKQLRCIHVEFLIPKRFVETNKRKDVLWEETQRDNVVRHSNETISPSVTYIQTDNRGKILVT